MLLECGAGVGTGARAERVLFLRTDRLVRALSGL